MHRLLRPTGVAVGLFAALASCASDQSFVPASQALSPVSATTANVDLPSVRISELHYDNPGTDIEEKVEISGPSGMSLNGWQLVLYNGSSTQRLPYTTTSLTGLTIPAVCGDRGVVVLSYGTNGIQNGSSSATGIDPDGMALVHADGSVVEFLSYEGSFTAASGPAVGMTSTDIGIRELGAAPEAAASPVWSLSRDGVGAWSGPALNTFGACNDEPPPPVARVVLAPSSAAIIEGTALAFVATAFDAADGPIPSATFTWSSSDAAVASINAAGVATGKTPGNVVITAASDGFTATASLQVDPPSEVKFSELHYDNVGVDAGESIEIDGPADTDLSGWSVVLYNGNGGAAYDARAVDVVIPDMCDGRGVIVLTYPQDGIQNGSPDGFALVDADDRVLEFLSYEGTFTAADGPAAGLHSVDIGVSQPTSNPSGQTLQRNPLGAWVGPASSSLGACHGGDPVPPTNFISFSGRTSGDPPLPVGFEDQLFATLRSPTGSTIGSTFVWEAVTPEIATIDGDGVMHAVTAGRATFRATAAEGTIGTFSLNMAVATPSATAQYANNAEFGEPVDGDPSDDFIVRRPQYITSFNKNRGIPNWVSYNLEATHSISGEPRCDCFTFDPELPSDFARYTTADYTGIGGTTPFHGYPIDRGHLVRSADRSAGSLDNATTYYFSNVIPQAADNNQGPWANMETAVGNLARLQNKEVYVIAGAHGSKGMVKDEGKITIPTHTWKVVVVMARNQGIRAVQSHRDLEVFAVIMPNDPGIRTNDPNDWRNYLTTVNAVEALTGYDVLALLHDRIESVIEVGVQDEMTLVDQLVTDGKINHGVGNSLQSKLESAAASIERGNANAATNQLEALLHELQALVGSGRLSEPDAQPLRAAVLALIASISS
ncbi:MAG: DNA/RNA non-specific endonuclease [Gemmatimonadaceae bacterium]